MMVLCPDTNIFKTFCKTSARVKPFKISVSVLMQNFWTCNVRLLVSDFISFLQLQIRQLGLQMFLYICSHLNSKRLKQEVVSNSTLYVRKYERTL